MDDGQQVEVARLHHLLHIATKICCLKIRYNPASSHPQKHLRHTIFTAIAHVMNAAFHEQNRWLNSRSYVPRTADGAAPPTGAVQPLQFIRNLQDPRTQRLLLSFFQEPDA